MGSYKIIIFCALLINFYSCSNKAEIAILKAENEELKEEYKDLKAQNDQNKQSILNQSAAINDALAELSQISGQTNLLRINVELKNAKLTQADKLQANIINLKRKLETLEQTVANNSELKRTVTSLRKIISEKEKEINKLKEVIVEQSTIIQKQDGIIDEQSTTIAQQLKLIERKNQELQSLINSQIELIYQSGIEFEKISDMDLEVSNKKNKRKVAEFKRQLKLKALEYYKLAADRGHSQAKIRYNNLYNKVY